MIFGSLRFQEEVPLRDEEFIFFRDRIFERAGIALSGAKRSLVQARLGPHLLSLGFKNFEEYRVHLESLEPSNPEWQLFTNLLTTNKTDFFREPAHFDYLIKKFLPRWESEGGQDLRVWSAASSTGQEPYTLSMCLKEHVSGDRRFEIHSSDIDTAVLREAQNAVYPRELARQIPEPYRSKSVSYGRGEISEWMRIRADVKKPVRFFQHNLVSDDVPEGAPYDVIFCRNVLIYFSKENIQRVVEKLYRAAKPGGLLFISHSESLHGIGTSWKNLQPSLFIKKGN